MPTLASIEKILHGILSTLGVMQTDIHTLKTDVSGLKTDIAVLKVDVADLKTDMAEVKIDVSDLKIDVSDLKTDVAILKNDTASLKTEVSGLNKEVSSIKSKLIEHDQRFDALEESVEFIKDNAVTKDELRTVHHEMLDHIDGLTQLHTREETEIIALHHRIDRHEQTYHRVAG